MTHYLCLLFLFFGKGPGKMLLISLSIHSLPFRNLVKYVH